MLAKAVDHSKDQTYFLYGLKPEQLSHTLFPLALYTKKEVREIAKLLSLETADRPESQDFVSGGDYASFFQDADVKEGDILDEEGHILGRHPGIAHYTVGQRRGLRVASRKPLYVTKIDPQYNRIIVSEKSRLYSKGLVVKDLHLHHATRQDKPYRVKVKIRLKHEETPAMVFPKGNNRAVILFDEPQAAVTPGQSAVFYLRDIVLGGGIIEETVGLAGAASTADCLERTEPESLGHKASRCSVWPDDSGEQGACGAGRITP